MHEKSENSLESEKATCLVGLVTMLVSYLINNDIYCDCNAMGKTSKASQMNFLKHFVIHVARISECIKL